MSELIFLVASAFDIDEYAEIMCPRGDPYASTRKFSAELIEATSGDALLGAVYEERGDRGMMRCLFGQIRYPYGLVGLGICRSRGLWYVPHNWGRCVFDFPIALHKHQSSRRFLPFALAYPEKLPQRGVVRLARLAFDVFLEANQLRASETASQAIPGLW